MLKQHELCCRYCTNMLITKKFKKVSNENEKGAGNATNIYIEISFYIHLCHL